MSLRPFLLTLGGVLVVAVGACTLNTAGLGATSGGSAAGAGGAPAATTAATGSEQVGQTSATGQSSGVVGTGGTDGTGASSGSTAASSGSASASASSASASASSSAASSSSSGGGVMCDSQFGSAAGYEFCAFKVGLCDFNVQLSGDTCRNACSKLGGECNSTFNNTDNSMLCQHGMLNQGCDAPFDNAVCRCALSCGNGPPCAVKGTCNNGTCIF